MLDFLGLDPPSVRDLAATESMIVNHGLLALFRGNMLHTKAVGCKGEIEPMLPQTLKLLEDFYRPYNAQLAALLGDELFAWQPPLLLNASQVQGQ